MMNANNLSDEIEAAIASELTAAGPDITSAEARTVLANAIASAVVAHITANAEADLGDGSIS